MWLDLPKQTVPSDLNPGRSRPGQCYCSRKNLENMEEICEKTNHCCLLSVTGSCSRVGVRTSLNMRY